MLTEKNLESVCFCKKKDGKMFVSMKQKNKRFTHRVEKSCRQNY